MKNNASYEVITNQIIEGLKRGHIPWHKPWTLCGHRSIRAEYSGSNVLSLAMHNAEHGHESTLWFTFKDIQREGGRLRKGAKSAVVIYGKKIAVKPKEGDDESKEVFLLRYYRVFNSEDTTGLEKLIEKHEAKEQNPVDIVKEAEKIAGKYVKTLAGGISHEGTAAYYTPGLDKVTMPPRDSFKSSPAYYSTLFHELTHSTGHESRLHRFDASGLHGFGSADYSKEELVAELGAAFLLAKLGIRTETEAEQNQAYINGWIERLQNDSSLIVSAGSQATKATNLIIDGEQSQSTNRKG